MHIYIHTRLYISVCTHRHTPTLQPNITHSSCATRSHLNGETTAQTGTNARAAPEGLPHLTASEPLGDTRQGHSIAPAPPPSARPAPEPGSRPEGSRSPGYRRPEGPLRMGSGARAEQHKPRLTSPQRNMAAAARSRRSRHRLAGPRSQRPRPGLAPAGPAASRLFRRGHDPVPRQRPPRAAILSAARPRRHLEGGAAMVGVAGPWSHRTPGSSALEKSSELIECNL